MEHKRGIIPSFAEETSVLRDALPVVLLATEILDCVHADQKPYEVAHSNVQYPAIPPALAKVKQPVCES